MKAVTLPPLNARLIALGYQTTIQTKLTLPVHSNIGIHSARRQPARHPLLGWQRGGTEPRMWWDSFGCNADQIDGVDLVQMAGSDDWKANFNLSPGCLVAVAQVGCPEEGTDLSFDHDVASFYSRKRGQYVYPLVRVTPVDPVPLRGHSGLWDMPDA